MIITVTGMPGSGKSTLAKNIAKELGLEHYSAGDLLRHIAKERGMSLLQLHHAMEEDKSVDEELDRRTEKFGKEMDNFVIDGRVAWHFIPNSIKVFVKIDLKAAATRVFADTVAGKEERSEESENISLEETMKNMEERMELNRTRYKRLYGIDYLDDNNYDIVVDTTESGIEETKEKVLNQIKQYLNEKKSD